MWAANNFTTTDIPFLSVIVQCYKPKRSKNHTAMHSVYYLQVVSITINWACTWAADNLAPFDMPFLSII